MKDHGDSFSRLLEREVLALKNPIEQPLKNNFCIEGMLRKESQRQGGYKTIYLRQGSLLVQRTQFVFGVYESLL